MMYKAIITRIKTSPHPNADKIQLGEVCGLTVVVGLDTTNNELGIYFPSDGKLGEEFCVANDLVGYKDPVSGESKGGYFGKNRKVRAQNFRGQKSDGFWCPLSYLFPVVGEDIALALQEGDEFETIDGIKICEKYYTPQTLKAMQNRARQPRKQHPSFPKHVDTNQLYKEVGNIPNGSILYFTEKLHGTSGRFGYVWTEEPTNKKWWQFWRPTSVDGWSFENGTRNVVLGKTDKSYYASEDFRTNVIRKFLDEPRLGSAAIAEGEILYYEIVGYTTTGQSIMPPVSTKELRDKAISKAYGNTMYYSYGCHPEGKLDTKPQCDMYVYRITRTDSKGSEVEYSWPQVLQRCEELGLKVVPNFFTDPHHFPNTFNKNNESDVSLYSSNGEIDKPYLIDLMGGFLERPSELDTTHISEGVVVRVEPPKGKPYWLKAKGHNFKVLEGITKEDDEYVDMEEVS